LDVNGVRARALGGDAAGHLDLADLAVDLHGYHIVSRGGDPPLAGEPRDRAVGLDAERDRFQRCLDALDQALPLAPRGGQVTPQLQRAQRLGHLDPSRSWSMHAAAGSMPLSSRVVTS
jgi:hypothetical protein